MNDILNSVVLDNTIRDYCWFIGIIVIVFIFKRFISKFLGLLLYKLFKRFSSEESVGNFTKLLIKPIALLVVLLTTWFAFSILKYPQNWGIVIFNIELKLFLNKIFQLAIVISLIWIALKIINYISIVLTLKAKKTDTKLDDHLIPFIKDFLKVAVVIFGIFFIFSAVFKFNITSLLAGLGIGGIAIALAAQPSLENLLGSFTIFLDKPFIVGDFVQVGDIIGTVEKVGFRSTRIRTLEKSFVTLPNKMIVDSIANNLTLRTYRRVKFFVGVTYDTSKEKIQAIVKDIQEHIDGHEQTNQEGIIGFHEFGDSSLNILVQYYAEHVDWNTFVKIKEGINFKIMEIVKKHGSDFAFPTRTVHLIKDD